MKTTLETPLRPLCNRSTDGKFALPPDNLYHLIPKGEFPNASGKVIQVVDAAACESILKNFAPELLMDFDHDSQSASGSTIASGWITALVNREDGIWGEIRWSKSGRDAVEGGDFRYVSPVFYKQECEALSNSTGNPQVALSMPRLRILRLAEAALTNKPNMQGLKPLTNKDSTGNSQVAPMKGTQSMDYKAALIKMLNLPAEADDAAIQTACDAAASAPKEDVPALKNRIAELETAELTRQVEGDLKKFKHVVTGTNHDIIKNSLLKNRAETISLLECFPVPAAAPVVAAPAIAAPVVLCNSAQTPKTAGDAAALLNERNAFIDSIVNERRCDSRAAAYEIARQRKPELFA